MSKSDVIVVRSLKLTRYESKSANRLKLYVNKNYWDEICLKKVKIGVEINYWNFDEKFQIMNLLLNL